MNDSSERKKGSILSYVSIVVNTLIQLLYTPILLRFLGQSEYGLYSLISSIIGYLSVLDLGFGNAIIVYTAKYRALGKKKEEAELHGMFQFIFIVIALITFLLGMILYFNIDILFRNTMNSSEIIKIKIMTIILTLNLCLTFVFSIYSSIISAYERFSFQKIISILGAIMKPVLMIPLLFLGFKSITMSVVITLVNLLMIISNYLYCKKKLGIKINLCKFNKKLFKTIFGYSFFIFLTIIVDKVNWSSNHFILGMVSGTIAVSIYNVASTLNQLFLNLSSAISGVFLPKMSKLISEGADSNVLTDEFIKVGRLQFYIIYLAATGLIIFGKQFIYFWVGNGFEDSYYTALFLVIPACFPLIQNLGLSIMQAMNKYKFKAITTTVMAFFNIIISVFLAKKFGAVGAASGTAVAQIICNIILINIYYKLSIKLNIFKFWKSILKMFVILIIPTLITSYISVVLNINNILIFILCIIIYTLLYFIFAFLFVFNKYEKDLFNSFFKHFKFLKGRI